MDMEFSRLLPITIVTAMVSPKARPRPNMDAPNMPEVPYGNNTFQMVSHCVAPSARDASRCECGMASRTSRVTDVIVGMIIMDKIKPAASRLIPLCGIGPEKSG